MIPPTPETTQKPRFSQRWIILGGIMLGILAALGLWWWSNRPIQPVVLSTQEKRVVEEKMESIQNPTATRPAEPHYEKGSKEIILTERELNGLLNEQTALGKSVKFELATNAILARIETDLDPDLPLFGGRRFKARARFLVSDTPGKASFILDDVTIWGISLPNDWLAGLKGHDLLSDVLAGGHSNHGTFPGVEEFQVEPGRLRIRLSE
jgi:hypothetical protein